MQKRSSGMRKIKGSKSFFPIAIWSLILLWVIVFIFMFIWTFIAANKSLVNFFMDSVWLPKKEYGGWQWKNWGLAFSQMKIRISSGRWVYFPEMLFNTLVYVIGYGFVSVLGPMLTSYVYAKYAKRVRWAKIAWLLTLVTMYVPISASLAASITLAMKLNIYDNLVLFALASFGGFGSNFLIYYAIWKGLSWEYAEAAFMDGAGHFTVLIKIMFPMTVTIFGVLFLTNVIALWADYQTPMVFLPSHPTLAYGVFSFQSSVDAGSSVPIKIASLLAVAAPMFVLFLIFKDKMMGSLTMGGLKG